VEIRRAKASDAIDASAVLRRSIRELCQADHNDDSAKIVAWTANKTPDEWNTWLHQDDVAIYVAVLNDQIAGVGAVTYNGEVRLNYVSPDARFCGVSKALLARMEEDMLAIGIARCTLESTKTAFRFYRNAGYHPIEENGVEGGWMEKRLAS
jgi:GNAT superfamily N-acetyltransferase